MNSKCSIQEQPLESWEKISAFRIKIRNPASFYKSVCGRGASALNTSCSADANRLIWNTMWWTINSPKSIVSCGNLCPALKGRGVSKANIVGKVRINLRFPASASFHHETGTKSSFKDNWVLNYQSFRRAFFFSFSHWWFFQNTCIWPTASPLVWKAWQISVPDLCSVAQHQQMLLVRVTVSPA